MASRTASTATLAFAVVRFVLATIAAVIPALFIVLAHKSLWIGWCW
jgi:hypothetical protein